MMFELLCGTFCAYSATFALSYLVEGNYLMAIIATLNAVIYGLIATTEDKEEKESVTG